MWAVILLGIAGLNLHPSYRSVRKVALSLTAGGFTVVLIPTIFHQTFNLIKKYIPETGDINAAEQYKELVTFLFGDIFKITLIIGSIALILGIAGYLVSIKLKRAYEHA